MIDSLGGLRGIPHIPDIKPASKAAEGGFAAALEGAVNHAENLQRESRQTVERFLSGEGGELHTTALAVQRAEMAFEMVQQVRNKVVQAYQEVMRMQM
jgi:flagellar hook-basal body complex protein FliE